MIGFESDRDPVPEKNRISQLDWITVRMRSQSDPIDLTKTRLNMEGTGIDRLPARASQSLTLLGVTSSYYRMGLRASNSSQAGQGA